MDFTFIRKPTPIKNFQHYRIPELNPVVERKDQLNNGFYFIGKNESSLEKLARIFRHGFAADNIEQAKSEITQLIDKEVNAAPEVIFCESGFSFKEIQNLYQFLNTHSVLFSIPLILDGTNLSEKDWGLYKKAKLVDEIIQLDETNEHQLYSKCLFLKKVKMRSTESLLYAFSQGPTSKIFHFSNLLKRIFDVTIASVALIILAPIFLVISMTILVESKGPVFYVSKRAGKGYRIFNFIKFRTMHMGADKNINEFEHLNQYRISSASGPRFVKIVNDPRITRFGSLLRKTSLDELPQLFNVLLGDMSIVGNRPLPLYEAATLTTDDCASRFMAPAGITGLWQIKKRGKENMSVEERINLDIDYANNSNFMNDLWIIANTPSAMIQKSKV
jgi:lipopolysaccharide/colanic/teichoic acid biosynthesis glycosyltransferase